MIDILVTREALIRLVEIVPFTQNPKESMDKLSIESRPVCAASSSLAALIDTTFPGEVNEEGYILSFLMFMLGAIAGRIEVDTE